MQHCSGLYKTNKLVTTTKDSGATGVFPYCMYNHCDLFTQCKKGDAKSQRILYDLFKAKLMGLCRRYTRSRAEAQDILQEAFIKIFNNLH
ncbi:MAG: hypothetical protein C0490_22330, partial [Marivirga sp.]|nr:hypothetical protein [Marivirga sp.]